MDGQRGSVYIEHVMRNIVTIHRSAHGIGSVSCLTIVVYLALVLFAAGCASMPIGSSEGHDHHSQDVSHSPLCAWSCQMISQTGPVTSVSPVVVNFVATTVLLPHVSTYSTTPFALRSSRAPPVVSLV